MENFLIKQENYLEAGVHIGTKLKVIDMNQFIYRMRNDGLYVLDLRKIDERIRLAGKMLAKYEPNEILVVASRTYSGNAASVLSSQTGIKVHLGRFIPGMLTNVYRDDFLEPKLILICDPKGERQAVIEAGKIGITTIGLCDTDNSTMYIDFSIPCNNKGKKSLALIFYLLTREYLMGRNKIASYDEFTVPISAFEADKQEENQAEKKEEAPASENEISPEQKNHEPENEKVSENTTKEDEKTMQKKKSPRKKDQETV